MTLKVFSAITSRALSISLVSGAVLFTNSAAQAKIINGDFEQSFEGWTTSGDVTVNGTSQASLATASSETSDVFTLETFLGLEPGQLTPSLSFFGATQGSAIKQSFTAQEGDVLSFDWQFLTEEVTDPLFPFFDKNDSAFLVLLNSTTSQAQVTTLADVFSGTAADSTTISTELQPDQTLNSTVRLQAGEYTLGFAVVDDTDVVATSTLLVDNIRQLNSSDPQSTPEPSLLLSLSILGPCFLRSRYRK